MAAFGLPLPREELARTPDAAADAAAAIGFPVVVKATAPGLAHKTERGLVAVGLGSEEDVRAAAAGMLGEIDTDAGADSGVLVAPVVAGNRELIAGLTRDATFGMCVMCGIGGIFTEALADASFRLVPITRADAFDMLDELDNQALLGPLRGEAALDREAAADVLLALSHLADEGADIVSADLNPLIVGADGRPVCVDALIEVTVADG